MSQKEAQRLCDNNESEEGGDYDCRDCVEYVECQGVDDSPNDTDGLTIRST